MKRSYNTAFRYVPKPGIRFRSQETEAQILARLRREQENLILFDRINQERRNFLRQRAGVRAVTQLQAAFRGRRFRNRTLLGRSLHAAIKGRRLSRPGRRWPLPKLRGKL